MTNKQNIESMLNDLSNKMKDNQKKRERNSFLYNLGSIFTGVLGTCLLFGNPWFGIPLIGGAVALQLQKKTMEENSQVSYNSMIAQSEHLHNLLKNGIKINPEVINQRKARINKAEGKRKKQEQEFYSSLGHEYLANALVAAPIIVGGFISNPLIALATVGCVGVKYLTSKDFREKHKNIEDTVCKMNNDITDHNISARIMNQRAARQGVKANTRSKSTVKTAPAKTSAQRYTKADEEAVDAYVRSLEGQGEKTRGVQKRKI